VRAEEQFAKSAMIPYAIAVLLTILSVPKPAALVAVYTLAIADPAAAVVGITWGRRKISENKSLEGSAGLLRRNPADRGLRPRRDDRSVGGVRRGGVHHDRARASACELLPLASTTT